MKRGRNEPAPPYGGRQYELVRGVREGMYWRAADGIEVRVAAGEAERESARIVRPARFGLAPMMRALFFAALAR